MIDPKIQEELRAKFNPDGSKQRAYQLELLDMLVDFDALCRSLGISYWLSSGTLLGAVRHGGFIPWDDDVDVDMTAHDYQILIKKFKESDKYVLQTYKNDPYYFWPCAKLRLKRKNIKETSNIDEHYKYKGIFMDIFIIEKRYDCIARLMAKISYILFKLSKEPQLTFIDRILFHTIKKIGIGLSYIIRLLTSKFLGKSYGHRYGTFYVKGNRDESEIFPLTTIEFEGHHFMAPRDQNAYLTRMFGDYMIFERRPTHQNFNDE